MPIAGVIENLPIYLIDVSAEDTNLKADTVVSTPPGVFVTDLVNLAYRGAQVNRYPAALTANQKTNGGEILRLDLLVKAQTDTDVAIKTEAVFLGDYVDSNTLSELAIFENLKKVKIRPCSTKRITSLHRLITEAASE